MFGTDKDLDPIIRGPPRPGYDLAVQGRRATCSEITANASKLTGVDPGLLEGYPGVLDAVLTTGRKLTRQEISTHRDAGRRAAESGVPLRRVLRAYLTATQLTWQQTHSEGKTARSRPATEAGFRAVTDTVAALADGYESAHRLALRQEEAARREFIDDLFYGRIDPGSMAERAQRFGLRLAEGHVVIVIEGDQFNESTQAMGAVETTLRRYFDTRDLVFTTKDGSLVCIAPSPLPNASPGLGRQVSEAIGVWPEWRIGIGRPHQGPGGVRRSYDEARSSLAFAMRLGYRDRVIKATDFLVFQVLLRDRAAIDDLIATVLAPLQHARGGAGPLIETLASYFACGTIHAAAEDLNLSVRAVSYRLDRVRKLTGYSATDPAQRFTLEAAVLGAKLLDWPN